MNMPFDAYLKKRMAEKDILLMTHIVLGLSFLGDLFSGYRGHGRGRGGSYGIADPFFRTDGRRAGDPPGQSEGPGESE